jgi:hypothetical protein
MPQSPNEINDENVLELTEILRDKRINALKLAWCKNLKVLPDLKSFTNLKKVVICLYDFPVDEVENKLPLSIEVMNLSKCVFLRREGDFGFVNFSRFIALRYLSLCRSNVTCGDLRGECFPVSLKLLDLSYCDLREGAPVLTGLVRLKELNFAGSGVPVVSLSPRTLPACVEVLNLTGCNFMCPEMDAASASVVRMPDLRWLSKLRILDIVCSVFSSKLVKESNGKDYGTSVARLLINAARKDNVTTENVATLFGFLECSGKLISVS